MAKDQGAALDRKKLMGDPIMVTTIVVLIAFLTLFILYPLAILLVDSFVTDSGPSFEVFTRIFQMGSFTTAITNTLAVGLLVSIVSALVGLLFAYVEVYVKLKTKFMSGLFQVVSMLPVVSPPFVLSLSIIMLFGKSGLITRYLLGMYDNSVYGFWGIFVVQTLTFFPVCYMMLKGLLKNIDPSLEEAARDMGASRWKVFTSVTLPLVLPGLGNAFLVTFIESIADFANPMIIGGSYDTLATTIYLQITGAYDKQGAAAMAVVLLCITLLMFVVQKYVLEAKSTATLSGKASRARMLITDASVRIPLTVICCALAIFVVVMYLCVPFGALFKTWGYDYTLTLDQYTRALQQGWDSLRNSIILGLIGALIGGLLGMVIAYITAKRDYYGKRFIEVSSVLMFAVPGTVLGIAYILAFNTGFLVLTGTAAILVIVFVFRNMPVAIESGTTTLLQIDNSIEEASTILGAGSGYSFRRISLPMLRNAFFSGLVYSFVKAITAVSAIIFLVSPRWDLVTSKIYTLFDQAKYSQAAAFVTMMVVILLVFIGIFNGLINLLLAPRSRVPKGAGIHEKTEETK